MKKLHHKGQWAWSKPSIVKRAGSKITHWFGGEPKFRRGEYSVRADGSLCRIGRRVQAIGRSAVESMWTWNNHLEKS